MAAPNHSTPHGASGVNGIHEHTTTSTSQDHGQEGGPASSAQQDQPLNSHHDQASHLPQEASACPYHSPILQLRLPRASAEQSNAIDIFVESPLSEVPVTLTADTRIGTAPSAGCTCNTITQELIDPLTQNAIETSKITEEDERKWYDMGK